MTSFLSVSTVYYNWHSLHAAMKEGCDLVPSEDGKVLYVSGIVKRYWYDFYYLGEAGKKRKEELRSRAVGLTLRSFKRLMTEDLSKNEVFDYITYMAPFVKDEVLGREADYVLYFKQQGFADIGFLKSLDVHHHKLRDLASVYVFEELSGRPIPTEDLRQLPQGRYSIDLANWIAHLNDCFEVQPWFWQRWLEDRRQVTGRSLHKVVKILCRKWGYSSGHVLYRLRELGCRLFDSPDPQFLHKRRMWIAGGQVAGERRVFPFGECLGEEGGTIIFRVKEASLWILISDNTARLQLNRIFFDSFLKRCKDK